MLNLSFLYSKLREMCASHCNNSSHIFFLPLYGSFREWTRKLQICKKFYQVSAFCGVVTQGCLNSNGRKSAVNVWVRSPTRISTSNYFESRDLTNTCNMKKLKHTYVFIFSYYNATCRFTTQKMKINDFFNYTRSYNECEMFNWGHLRPT